MAQRAVALGIKSKSFVRRRSYPTFRILTSQAPEIMTSESANAKARLHVQKVFAGVYPDETPRFAPKMRLIRVDFALERSMDRRVTNQHATVWPLWGRNGPNTTARYQSPVRRFLRMASVRETPPRRFLDRPQHC